MKKVSGIDIDYGYVEMQDLLPYGGEPDKVTKAVNYAVSGLFVDGADHKQWALEQVLESLGFDLKELRQSLQEPDEDGDTYSWEEGIAP